MAGIINAIYQLLDFLFRWLGPGWTLFYALVAVGIATSLRLAADRRKDRYIKLALDEKERTVQRLASEAREWRIFAAITIGMDRHQAERVFTENAFLTPAEARRALERPRPDVSDRRGVVRPKKPKSAKKRRKRR